MPPIPASLRKLANRLPATTPDLPEREHFHTCPICGQQVDRRRLGNVIHHEMPGHARLPD